MILLDTHIWLRWLLPTEPLPIKWVEQIEQTEIVTVAKKWDANVVFGDEGL